MGDVPGERLPFPYTLAAVPFPANLARIFGRNRRFRAANSPRIDGNITLFTQRITTLVKTFVIKFFPWIITAVALYYAFHEIRWDFLFAHLREAKPEWLILALVLTISSYLLRSRRWQFLFPQNSISFLNSFRVLILGFFMNNILPARAGEFVRAHLGAQLTGQSRALVLATIGSERLVDGLTISIMFVIFSLGLGDSALSHNLLLVAGLFGLATVGVLTALVMRRHVFKLGAAIDSRFNNHHLSYVLQRLKIFLNGLAPLFSMDRLPYVVISSIAVWTVELMVYRAVSYAYGADLSIAGCVLFLVAVNFASLIPSAPGAIGVIEVVAKLALVSIGIENERALSMAITQHVIQYLVVGAPGAIIMLNWKKTLADLRKGTDEE